jgi:hypothetical protein
MAGKIRALHKTRVQGLVVFGESAVDCRTALRSQQLYPKFARGLPGALTFEGRVLQWLLRAFRLSATRKWF